VAVLAAFQEFVGEVFRLNGQLLASAECLSREINVSPARWQTIAVLRNGPLPVAGIARELGIRRQSVQHNVDRLVSQGLAELRPNPLHRRARLVALTDRGQAVMAQLAGFQASLTRLFVGDLGLSAGELRRLAGDLRRIRRQADPDASQPE
jgi:DNA-binding MarR family transcriptional regulator